MIANDCSSPPRISHEHKVAVERTTVFTVWALHYRDVEIVEGSCSVFGRIELRKHVREPCQQLGTGALQGIFIRWLKLGADDAHSQRVNIAAYYACAKTSGLDQCGATSSEWVEHAETRQRTFSGAEQLPEIFCCRVGVEVAGNK